MERPLLCLLILLPLATAVSDDVGDVAQINGGPAVTAPHVDLVRVDGMLDNGTITLSLETAGELRPARVVNASREFAYLFIVAIGADADDDLYTHLSQQQPSLVVRCGWHQGVDDAGCRITAGEGAVRSLLIDDRNLTTRVDVDWDERFAIGGAATESHADADPQVVAQDFTDNALPYREPEAPAGEETMSTDRPWWMTPWILVVAIIVGVAFGLWRRSRR